MKKSILMGVLSLVVLASCSHGGSSGKKEVAVFGPKADHGWTGAVLSDIQDKAKALNAAQDKYNYVVYSDASAEDQAKSVDDVLARKKDIAGIVIQPSSNEAEGTVTKIASSGLPFVQFDRIISNDTVKAAKNNISNVKGDNYSTGVASAERFLAKGLKKTDKILVMPGDNSSVPGERTQGFKDTLKKNGWTDAEVKSQLLSTDYTGWSRDKSITLYETFVQQHTADLADYKWYYTHDSEITMGILQALTANNITDASKKIIADNVKGLVGCGGLEEVYQVIRGDHPRSQAFNAALPHADIVDVTYDPAMMATAMQDMADYLDGKTVTKDHVIASEAVNKDNIGNKVGFGGKVTA
jgi:ribose transport system substrate-binding protein